MIKAALLATPEVARDVYGQGRREQIALRAELLDEVISPEQLAEKISLFQDIEVIFTGWGMPSLTKDQIANLPRLKAVFYAAGSVQAFARPLLVRGITVVSAWRANAIPVAEFTLAQLLLATKGYFRNLREYHTDPASPASAYRGPGNYGETIALLGAGAIGRKVIEMLQPFHLNIVVYDPFLDTSTAAGLGVEKVTLEAAFECALVVSNHLPEKPETIGLVNADLMARLRPGATLINTGRGKTINPEDLYQTLLARPDLTALLDVTEPEPLPANSQLFALANIQITTHIAGSIGDETLRLADYCLEDFDRYLRGEPLRHQVTLEMLDNLA